jgi:hypothetical protein
MANDDVDDKFEIGDLVYYKGFNIFPTETESRQHMGIIIRRPEGMPHASSYLIYWFESSLTTRMHYDMITLVYGDKAKSI